MTLSFDATFCCCSKFRSPTNRKQQKIPCWLSRLWTKSWTQAMFTFGKMMQNVPKVVQLCPYVTLFRGNCHTGICNCKILIASSPWTLQHGNINLKIRRWRFGFDQPKTLSALTTFCEKVPDFNPLRPPVVSVYDRCHHQISFEPIAKWTTNILGLWITNFDDGN